MKYTEAVDSLQNVAQYIARTLEDMILRGQLAPGVRLVQTDLAERFGVSRVPVRDALQLLMRKDLVVSQPRRGVVVRPVTRKEVQDLFDLRELLEEHAYVNSLPHLSEAQIGRAASIVEEQEQAQDEFPQLMAIDERFHQVLFSGCTNDELLRLVGQVWNRIRILRAHSGDVRSWRRTSIAGHKRVLEAIRRGDLDEAKEELVSNIRRSREDILSNLASEL